MLVLTRYTDPTKANTNTVNMNFDDCSYAIVYTTDGEVRLVALNSGALSLRLAAGEAAFVVPSKNYFDFSGLSSTGSFPINCLYCLKKVE